MRKQLEEDIKKPLFTDNEDDEILTNDNCPICGYPIVLECGLEVCYSCGWGGDMK